MSTNVETYALPWWVIIARMLVMLLCGVATFKFAMYIEVPDPDQREAFMAVLAVASLSIWRLLDNLIESCRSDN